MYMLIVISLMFVGPVASILWELNFGAETETAAVMLLLGKWHVFWCAGVRPFLVGLRQVLQPSYALEVVDVDLQSVVRNIGSVNLSLGVIGMSSYFEPAFVTPVAIAAVIVYGLSGAFHGVKKFRTWYESIVLMSDVYAAAVLSVYLVWVALQ